MLVLLNGEERWKVLRLHVEDQIPLAALAWKPASARALFNAGISSTGLVMQARSMHSVPNIFRLQQFVSVVEQELMPVVKTNPRGCRKFVDVGGLPRCLHFLCAGRQSWRA